MKVRWFFFLIFALAPLSVQAAEHYRNDWFEFDYPAGWQIREGSEGDLRFVALQSPDGKDMCLAGVEPTWKGIGHASGHERRVATVLADYPELSRRGSPNDNVRPEGVERTSVLSDSAGNLSWISTLLAAGALVTTTCSTPAGYEQAAGKIFESLHAGRPGRLRLSEPDSRLVAASLVGRWDTARERFVFRKNGTVSIGVHSPSDFDVLYAELQHGHYTVERGLLRMRLNKLSGEGVDESVCVFSPDSGRLRLYCRGWSDEVTYIHSSYSAPEQLIVGTLALVLVSAVTLTLPFCFFCVYRFRKAISALMNQASIRDDVNDFRDTQLLAVNHPSNRSSLLKDARTARWRLFAVYLVSGTGAASCLTAGFEYEYVGNFTALWFISDLPVLAWPILLIAREVLGRSWGRWRLVLAAYFGFLLLLGVRNHITNADFRVWDILRLWLLVNGFPTVIYFVLANRKVKTIGPLVFSLATISMAAMWGLGHVAGTNLQVGSVLERVIISSVRMSAQGFAFTVRAIGVVLSLPVLYIVFRAVARAYERRWFSEQSLIIGSIWMLFALSLALPYAIDGDIGAAELWTVCAIPSYFIVNTAGLQLLRRPRSGPGLLILRAFALGHKSETVFDAVGGLWRFIGPVRLIGGADLASRLIQPSTLLRFLAGHLSSIFIDSHSTLRNQLANLSGDPDPDGRFRIEEFFCYNNTWERTVTQLALRSSVILMDFRTFSTSRAGCEREMRELLPIIPIERIVLVLDDDTDRTYLSRVINEVLGNLEVSSPNYKAARTTLRQVEFGRHDATSVEAVCEAVFQLMSSRQNRFHCGR
ncbi:MAG: hypothetical protein ACXV96_02245 [Candidatus Angelobacter sp.]